MKKTKYLKFVYILFATVLFYACEKVIDVDLDVAEKQLVIEGNITSEPGPYEVIISTSGGYFDNTAIQPVENGLVTITDETGNSEVLTEASPGKYLSSTISGVENRNYSIEVVVDGQVYTASEYLPRKVTMDSIYYELDDFGFSNNDEVFYNIHCTFTDPAETEDYYRIVIYVNGGLVKRSQNRYRIFDDEMFNGNTITTTVRGTEAEPGDTVRLELQTIGYNTYTFYSGLNDATSGSGMGSTPYNPTSNLSNGALGYFGAYSVSAGEVIIQQTFY